VQLTRRDVRAAGLILIVVGALALVVGAIGFVVAGYLADERGGDADPPVAQWVAVGVGTLGVLVGITVAICADFVERKR
jgi:hypothetical protein